MRSRGYHVAELAERTGLPPSTLRFYEQTGLLPARRSASGYRLFDDRAVARVGVIGTGKRLGLPLAEIRELLEAWDGGLCRDVRERLRPMVLNRIADAERRSAELGAFLGRLRETALRLAGPPPAGPCGPGCGMMPGESERVRPVSDPPAIACALDAAGQADRVGEWQRLLAQAVAREPAGSGLAFRFPAGLAGPVAELAAAEQRCCAFFDFTLRLSAGELRLEVRVPPGAEPRLGGLFGEQGGDVPAERAGEDAAVDLRGPGADLP